MHLALAVFNLPILQFVIETNKSQSQSTRKPTIGFTTTQKEERDGISNRI